MTDLTKRDDALLPCPFCGCGPARAVMDTGFSGVELMGTNHPYVWCGTCGASGSFEEDDNKAIAAWNTRAQPTIDPAAIREAALQARIGELEKQCSAYARADQLFVDEINELEAKLTECEARLSKAVEAMRFYSPQTVGGITFVGGDDAGKRAAAMLAELEGKE